jgi:hypothetical protein
MFIPTRRGSIPYASFCPEFRRLARSRKVHYWTDSPELRPDLGIHLESRRPCLNWFGNNRVKVDGLEYRWGHICWLSMTGSFRLGWKVLYTFDLDQYCLPAHGKVSTTCCSHFESWKPLCVVLHGVLFESWELLISDLYSTASVTYWWKLIPCSSRTHVWSLGSLAMTLVVILIQMRLVWCSLEHLRKPRKFQGDQEIWITFQSNPRYSSYARWRYHHQSGSKCSWWLLEDEVDH